MSAIVTIIPSQTRCAIQKKKEVTPGRKENDLCSLLVAHAHTTIHGPPTAAAIEVSHSVELRRASSFDITSYSQSTSTTIYPEVAELLSNIMIGHVCPGWAAW